jgi:acid phosphatase type 7
MGTGRRRFAIVLLCAFLLAAGYAGYVGARVTIGGYCLEDELPFGLAKTRLATRPYVQDVTSTSAALIWWTPDPTGATLRYGIAPELTETRDVPAARRHEVVLTGLQAGARYAYEVTNDGDAPIAGTLRTAPDATATATIGVFGDSGAGGSEQDAVADLLAAFSPDLLLHTGDVVYPHGGICDYEERFFAPYADLLASVPLYPTIGNHDLDAEDGRAFFDVFRLPEEDEDAGAFYAFDYGPAHVVVLDGERLERDDGDAVRRLDELAAELDRAAERRPWTIVVVHRPPVPSAGDSPMSARVAGDLFVRFAGRVDLILSGHVHAYARGEGFGNIPLVITGGGGAELHNVAPSGELSVARSLHHAVRLTVSPDALTIEAVAPDGTVFDRHVLSPES